MDVEPYDHLRASGDGEAGDAADLSPGVYRVVGVDDGAATLLRVADADGTRVRSGRVERVAAPGVEALAAAENPDANTGPLRALALLADGLAWTLRGGLRRLAP